MHCLKLVPEWIMHTINICQNAGDEEYLPVARKAVSWYKGRPHTCWRPSMHQAEIWSDSIAIFRTFSLSLNTFGLQPKARIASLSFLITLRWMRCEGFLTYDTIKFRRCPAANSSRFLRNAGQHLLSYTLIASKQQQVPPKRQAPSTKLHVDSLEAAASSSETPGTVY